MTLFGIVIDVKPEQERNALDPIDVTLFPIVKLFIELLLEYQGALFLKES